MSRLLTKRERVDLRHYLQVLTEQARAVRNAIESDTGVLAITDEAWADQWASLTRDLDSVTERITGPAADHLDKVREQARRYLEAQYGKDVWYAAPETFNNMLERWIWAVASGCEGTLGEECTAAIEAHMAARRG
jgi:hypothetical protein